MYGQLIGSFLTLGHGKTKTNHALKYQHNNNNRLWQTSLAMGHKYKILLPPVPLSLRPCTQLFPTPFWRSTRVLEFRISCPDMQKICVAILFLKGYRTSISSLLIECHEVVLQANFTINAAFSTEKLWGPLKVSRSWKQMTPYLL